MLPSTSSGRIRSVRGEPFDMLTRALSNHEPQNRKSNIKIATLHWNLLDSSLYRETNIVIRPSIAVTQCENADDYQTKLFDPNTELILRSTK